MLDFALFADYFAAQRSPAPNTTDIWPAPLSVFPICVQTRSVDLQRSSDHQVASWLRTPLSFSSIHRGPPLPDGFSVEGLEFWRSIFFVVDSVADRCNHPLYRQPIDCSEIEKCMEFIECDLLHEQLNSFQSLTLLLLNIEKIPGRFFSLCALIVAFNVILFITLLLNWE